MSNGFDVDKFEKNVKKVQEIIDSIESAIKELGNVYHLGTLEFLKDESNWDVTTKYFKDSIDQMDKDSLEKELQDVADKLRVFHNEWSYLLYLVKALEYKENQQVSNLVVDLISKQQP